MKKILKKSGMLVLVSLVVFGLLFGTKVEAKSTRDSKETVNNSEIEQIIDNSEKEKNYCDTMTDEELDEFFETGNENALIGKSEEEIQEYFLRWNVAQAIMRRGVLLLIL